MLKNLTKNQIEMLQEGFKNEGESSYEFILGNRSDIIISAPHSSSFTKDGKIYPAEYNSGVIAKLLNKYFGYSILCKTKNCGDDANSDEKSDYKNQLASVCRKYSPIVVLDLHTISKGDFVQTSVRPCKMTMVCLASLLAPSKNLASIGLLLTRVTA